MKKGKLETSVNEIILNYSNAPEEVLSKAKIINSLNFSYNEYFMPSKNGGHILTMYGSGFEEEVKIMDYKMVFELNNTEENKSVQHKFISGIVQIYDRKTTRLEWKK